jgi:hypothetical protein
MSLARAEGALNNSATNIVNCTKKTMAQRFRKTLL